MRGSFKNCEMAIGWASCASLGLNLNWGRVIEILDLMFSISLSVVLARNERHPIGSIGINTLVDVLDLQNGTVCVIHDITYILQIRTSSSCSARNLPTSHHEELFKTECQILDLEFGSAEWLLGGCATGDRVSQRCTIALTDGSYRGFLKLVLLPKLESLC